MWWALNGADAVLGDIAVAVFIVTGTLGSAVLLGLAIAAFLRRQSRPYLLVALALSALFARSAVAAISLTGLLDLGSHHVIEHALDVVLAALVIAAVFDARSLGARRETND